MPVSMNGWMCEKARGLVKTSIALLRLAELVDPDALCPWPETVRESIEGRAWLVYYRACEFVAYATGGFPQDLAGRCRQAFSEGPGAMEAYAGELEAREDEGWDLPHPGFHHAVLAWPLSPGDESGA
jgi:hypothetical protein